MFEGHDNPSKFAVDGHATCLVVVRGANSPELRARADEMASQLGFAPAKVQGSGDAKVIDQMVDGLFGSKAPVDGAPRMRTEVRAGLRKVLELSMARPSAGIEILKNELTRQLAAAELAETLTDHGLDGLERADQLEVEAETMARVRKQSTLGESHLLRFVGIQLTARALGEHRRLVTRFDVDSSVTSAQTADAWLSHVDSLGAEGKQRVSEAMSQAIHYAHDSIAPALRGYKSMGVVRLGKLSAAGLTLRAPDGVRIHEL